MSNDNNVLAITDNMGNTAATNSTAILTTTSNCITGSGLIGGAAITGSYTYPIYYSYPQYIQYDIQLRKLENGWVLLKGGKEYILKNPEDVIKYMKENK